MQDQRIRPVSGHAYHRNGKWYVKYRAQGKQYNRLLGPVWEGRGSPLDGYFRAPTAKDEPPADVKAALAAKLTDLRRDASDRVRTGVTFADAAEEWLLDGEHVRNLKRSTLGDYRSALRHLIAEFGDARIETVTKKRIEDWQDRWRGEHGKQRQEVKLLAILHGIFKLAQERHGLDVNPAVGVRRPRVRYDGAKYSFYSPEEVMALARAAASEQDGAMYVTAAFAGLRRGELVALRWRDVDFAGRTIRVEGNYSFGEVVSPKSGRSRSLPMVPEVAQVLARLSQRERWTADDDLVFPNDTGEHVDASALRRRYMAARKRADVRPLRFHDLRHTFGSLAINFASIVEVQTYMGHRDAKTTMRYLHHKSRGDEADRLARAFRIETAPVAPVA